MPNKKTDSILVLEKAMAVLKCFQKDSPELHIPQLSEKLGIPKPTIHRILVTLERGKFVKKKSRYRSIPLRNRCIRTGKQFFK